MLGTLKTGEVRGLPLLTVVASITLGSSQWSRPQTRFKLQLHDAIYRLRFFSNSLIHILSLSNSHNNVASIQKNRGDKSHCVIVALCRLITINLG